MGSGMLDEFVLRKHHPEKIRYEHPLLEPILRETHGTVVYQEQVMEIAKQLAGFTPGQADVLRKAMGKKVPEELEQQRGNFLAGTRNKGIKEKLANKIFDQLVHFGGYGFNKSHATAYAVLAYRTAYLKANAPIPFMTALLSSEIGRTAVSAQDKENKLVVYLEQAKSMKLGILPPDVQKSGAYFEMEKTPADKTPSIRFGLLAIKNVGVGAVESILQNRREKGSFLSLSDLCTRVDTRQVNKKVMESLIKAGALDSLGNGELPSVFRARMTAALDDCLAKSSRIRSEIEKGQELLFSAQEVDALAGSKFSQSEHSVSWSEHELLNHEKEVLGFYLSGHPLARYTSQLRLLSDCPIDRIPSGSSARVRLAGMIVHVKRLVTKSKGESWARVKLEDLTGEVEVLVFPKAYASGLNRHLISGNVVVVSGRLNPRGEEASDETEVIAEEILPLEEAIHKTVRGMVLSLSSAGLEDDFLKQLREVLSRYPGPCEVKLKVATPVHGNVTIETGLKVNLNEGLFSDLEQLLGERSWALENAS